MGLTELKNKLAAIVPETDFKLDERSTLDILNWLKEYAAKIPFDQDRNKFWDSFYFIQENTPEKLADIYQNINKADGHLPAHQAFILAFLKLLETTKVLFNTFPARHRDLYYRELLGLKPRNAQADNVALGITLNPDNAEYLIPKGTLFDAGQDSAGNPLQYASDADLLANQGKLTDLRWYRKDNDSWKSAILLSDSDNIELPENGIRLFSPTPNDVPVLSGYLITSSLFAMSKGVRSIRVTLANEWMGNPNNITAQISSGKHWLSLLVEKAGSNLKLILSLSANDEPISPPDALDNMEFNVPVLKLGTVQGPILPKITDIEISISGNSNVRYSSDGSIEKTGATSFPFGQSPLPGSGFNLIAPEWYGTENATVTITPQWVGLPITGFKNWYKGYNPEPENNAFKVTGYLVTPQEKNKLKEASTQKEIEAQPLFDGTNKPQGKSLSFPLPAMNYPIADSQSPNDWPAFIRIELAEQDFMHSQYWQNPTDKNQPYTPQISSLKIEFSAEIKTGQYSVYPLTPFGWDKANAETLPLISNTFYLGFTDVLPGQTLSLYWQLDGIKERLLSWFYLNQENTWSPLDNLVHDQTRNLFNRGGLSTLLPHDASNQASQMPKGRHWLKAQILQTSQAILTDLYWNRKDNDGWKSATPLRLSNNMKLPTNGIQIFSPTSNDIPVLSGYLITWPLFTFLKKGLNITLILGSKWEGNSENIAAKISSGNHWLTLSVEYLSDTDSIKLQLPDDDNNDPISPPDALDNMTFDTPLLKLTTTQDFTLPWIYKICINSNIVLSASDNSEAKITRFPFGQSPSLDSSFSPKVVLPEWVNSEYVSNTTFTITPQWVNLPTENFSSWYKGYANKPTNNNVFKVEGYLVTPYREEKKLDEILSLFDGENAPQGKSLTFTLPDKYYFYSNNHETMSIKIKLAEQDFMHAQYQQRPTGKKQPYTPQLSELQVEFSATAFHQQFSIYPLTPFGKDQAGENITALTHDTFYLGFTDIAPGQTFSLYWQLKGLKDLSLSWFYLSQKNTWKLLNRSTYNQTDNLFESEDQSILLPQDASNQTSQMPSGRYWLKAQIEQEKKQVKIVPPDYPRIKGLLYNATTATLINTVTVEQDYFIRGLAANSIKQPVNSSVAISEVAQPWASWNSRPKEDEQTFLKRVPARLSHRNRALNWGDIVTLLKERFISIFDVKYPSTNELTKIPAPEKRKLIVIPDNRYKDNGDSLRPELNQARLTEMVEWLDRLSSPWTTIEINNPTYVDVPISYELIFASGVNPDYGRHQLQQELSRIYMPWGENTAIGVTPGNRIDYYQLLATIQQSPWVERVTSLTLKKGSPSTDVIGKSVEADDDEVLILVWK
ncbi:hypothetical protein GPY51_03750 [Photorhabdus laumondii subsp. laumondii]|uniref:Baseplate protein J-like domain-containing protein n=1 Tax=Photorhabdus laumondii subsp. laumondii TaxID=141679 RepID=A0A6L9JGP0_PHOLM|nr:hypothetical protein [Photorhabdus laumondii]MCC8383786.1 hypothetical protein [Photorhabdus laumondii]MCC8412817.1 hypothetical protein [Photorhabdus laumondii]NDK93554.1 hypothetical protein [Photorhabdus laumondii subsp. laumondii]NDL20098.1 hypothetical protein [Photorhabdus laumondii subsp. laumondii]NDL28872.1 hypothetical protein [Photorhabdus laumondii subsp. laumondii]